MLNSWFALTMLVLESNEVIGLRLNKVAQGGGAAVDETRLMFSEKISAFLEANTAVMGGASSLTLISRYRELVAANHARLS